MEIGKQHIINRAKVTTRKLEVIADGTKVGEIIHDTDSCFIDWEAIGKRTLRMVCKGICLIELLR